LSLDFLEEQLKVWSDEDRYGIDANGYHNVHFDAVCMEFQGTSAR
jgi:hypothetical protein